MRGWLRRPAGLAFAGGLCAVIFAVAFGTKMYQESLERGPRTVPTENGPSGPRYRAHPSPPQPSSVEPPLKSGSKHGFRAYAGEERCAGRPIRRAKERAGDVQWN